MKSDNISKAYNILSCYNGNNNQILYYQIMYKKNNRPLDNFDVKYIIANEQYERKSINKIVAISSDCGLNLRDKFYIDFIPQKIYIGDIIGEIGNSYHCYVQYRKSVPLQLMYINKKYILDQLEERKSEEIDIDFGKYDKITENIGRTLKEHQKSAVKFLLANKKCILADSQGLGKTTSAIVAALEGGFNKILIITTKALKTTWKKEMEYYVDSADIGIVNGTNWINDKKFTIINYDIIQNFYKIPEEQIYETQEIEDEYGVKHLVNAPAYKVDKKTGEMVPKMKKSTKKSIVDKAIKESVLFQSKFDCVIIDEVQKLSNNSSIRYKTIYDFLMKSHPECIFLLTGTPLTNRPLNLYHILKLIGAEVTRDYKYYCKRYCDGKEMKLKKSRKTVMINNGATNLNELRDKIKHLYIRRLQSEVPGMVDKHVYTKTYDLNSGQKEKYDKLWQEYVDAQEEIGKEDTESYRQLVEGIIVRQYLAKEMTKHTIEMVDDAINYGEKVIVICTFKEEIDIFQKYYGEKCVVYDGTMSTKQKDEAVNEFMNNPNVYVFVGQIIACGVGLTLTASNYLIFNSFSWCAADNLQAEDRIYRISQNRDVTCVYQLFSDSISQHMFNTVMRKEVIMNETIKSENEK